MATREDLCRELGYIRWVNKNLGGSRVVVDHLRAWAESGNLPSDELTVLDVATGSADIPAAILFWAREKQKKVRVIGLDLHPVTLDIARQWTNGHADISLVRGDALRLPLSDGAVDIATCSMFLHHLDESTALAVIREMLRVSRRGVVINDLLRATWARVAIHLLTVFAAAKSRHDARLSVAKGWTAEEADAWRSALSAPWLECHVHPFARFTLAGLRPTN